MFIARPQVENCHRSLKNNNVIDSIFHFVSSCDWEIVALAAEIQGRGGGGDAGGTTSWDLLNDLLDDSATWTELNSDAIFLTLIFLFFVWPQPTNGGPRKVLFHTQPDVLYLNLQDGRPATSLSPPDLEDEDVCATNRQLDTLTHHKYKRSPR